MKKWFTDYKKYWNLMRICTVHGMMTLLMCSVAMAHTNHAQILEREITISLHDVSLKVALKEVERSAGIRFVYSTDQFDLSQRVSIEVVKGTLGTVLDKLLTPSQIHFTVHEKEGFITLRKERQEINELEAQSFEPPKYHSKASINISGTVRDEKTQQVIPGVNVIIKGSTNGTSTDADGHYSLDAEEGETLVFSFIGYKTMEVRIGSSSVVDVTLEEDIASLNEVVINAGYWQVTDKDRTGNIVKIEAKDIAKQPVQNPLASLLGRVAGLEITQSTGVPGGNFKVRIRGTNSIANGNDPLYIIDGVPFTSSSLSFQETSGGILGNPSSVAGQGSSPLNSINPSDIQSIEVLKDADATAIYGSRGANGVILITTKKGQAGKTKVDVNFYSGISQLSRKADLLNLQQYLDIRKEAFTNDGIAPTPSNAPDLTVWDTTRFTDWQKKLIGGKAHTTDAQVSVSGGEQNTQFSFGVGYHRETAVFPGSNSDQRASTHINVTNTSPNEKLKTTLSLNYSINSSDLLSGDLTSRALNLAPNAPALYDANGNLSWTNWTANMENPLAYTNRRYESTINNLIGNAVVSYSILPNLEVRSNLGYTSNISKATNMIPIRSLDPQTATTAQNTTSFSNSDFKNWIIEPQVAWKPKLGEGQFNILAGGTFLNQSTEGLAQTAVGFTSEAIMKNLAAATGRTLGTNYYSQYRYQAWFGRLNYIYKDRYIVNLTGRRDGSSRFGPGKQFATFGAVGAAWLFSEEQFIKDNLAVLSFAKLRASYGTTGNDQIGDYQYLDSYSIKGSGFYQTANGLTPSRLSNPDFAWETNKKLEIGLDFGLWTNRLTSTVSYYNNRSTNQLVGFPLSAATGFTSVQGNFPAKVQNSGIEVSLNSRNIETKDFSWSTAVNLTIPRNKLVEFPNLEAFPAYNNQYVVGEPLSIVKLYHYTGLDPVTGSCTFEDINGDGYYDFNDRKTVKFLGQDFYGGISNSFQYNGLQLDFLLQFVKQTGYRKLWGTPGSVAGNQDISVLNRWQSEGDITDVAKASTTPNNQASLFSQSDFIVTNDVSFVRLKNLSLMYSFPDTWTRKVQCSNVRIFVQGQNLFVITKYNGLDPETWNSDRLPPLRTVTIGLHITF